MDLCTISVVECVSQSLSRNIVRCASVSLIHVTLLTQERPPFVQDVC